MIKPIYALVKVHRIIESCMTIAQLENTRTWLIKYQSKHFSLSDSYGLKKALISKSTELRERHETLCNKVGDRY